MKRCALVVAVFAMCVAAYAKPKTKTFKYPPKQVFEAALKAAREHHVVSYVDEAHLMFTFETGKSMSSYGNKCNVSVEPGEGENSAEMVINTQTKSEKQLFSWGAGGRLADDLFNWTEEKLRKAASSPPDVKPESGSPITSQVPSGTVTVASDPDSADVYADGSFVGNTPASLHLSPGKHTVKIAVAGYADWQRDVNVLSGSTVSLKAKLEKNPQP